MDVFELREYLKGAYKKQNSGKKHRDVILFTESFLCNNKERVVRIKKIYDNIDIKVSYQYFIKCISDVWILEKDGGVLLLNVVKRKDL